MGMGSTRRPRSRVPWSSSSSSSSSLMVMAVSPSSSATLENPDKETPISSSLQRHSPLPSDHLLLLLPETLIQTLPPSLHHLHPSNLSPSPAPPAPSFRPPPVPSQAVPHFSPLPVHPNSQNPGLQNPILQPTGISPFPVMPPGAATGAAAVKVSVSPLGPAGVHHATASQPPNSPALAAAIPRTPNGYPTAPRPRATAMPPVVPHSPMPYPIMVRPTFPPHPPAAIGTVPPLRRPPVPANRGVPPIVSPVVRPVIPIVAPTEKPHTTVYVGKIAASVENDFMLSLLRLCGPVKSWKRAQDPSDGTSRGFGFCEFESAEGVLRALRMLSKFNVDGQELMLNVNQATREYLERFIEKKTEREKKLKEDGTQCDEKEGDSAPGTEKNKLPKPSVIEPSEEDDPLDKEDQDAPQKFGIVTNANRDADKDALEKLMKLMEERIKSKPPPPPPPVQNPANGSAKSNPEVPTKLRDKDPDVDIMKTAEDKNDDEMSCEKKVTTEHDWSGTSYYDKGRRHDKRSRERDRERDLKWKEHKLERYEREQQRERARREREHEMKIREAEHLYKERLKELEYREREKEYQLMYEREKEKGREWKRRNEIMDQEDESDEDDRRKPMGRSSEYEERRRKRLMEKEEDLIDRLREEEEIAEANRRLAECQQQQKDDAKFTFDPVTNGDENPMMREGGCSVEDIQNAASMTCTSDYGLADHAGSGKRVAVPSVFHEEDDEDMVKEKKMRPLVPIDYSTEELQEFQATTAGQPSLMEAEEFAKRISSLNPKEERPESETESRKYERNDEMNTRRDESRGKMQNRTLDREHVQNKLKMPESKKLLDAKQLIDMIPKTKEELFAYDINWAVYDKRELHERMRRWISKKITEFLGEEEVTLVNYIVSCLKEHVRASEMLELLQSILDEEAEMFVLKMWRMLIFEIKRVETGLSLKSQA